MTLFGHSRSIVRRNYALLTPPGMVQASLPDWPAAACTVAISPALGAQFSMVLVRLTDVAAGRAAAPHDELFVYVLAGTLRLQLGTANMQLTAGGYVYIPAASAYELSVEQGTAAELLVFQRPYQSLPAVAPPGVHFAQEQDVSGTPFMGDDAALLQLLLPDTPAFDMAVNIFTFQPGATLPIVETHVMEHGLLMLQGQGIYRLGDDWYPVQAGDMIWMAPFCPQWFVATGKTPARYLYYKNVNRSPGGRSAPDQH